MKLLLIAITGLLLAGCSNPNFDQQVQLQISNLEQNAKVAQTACDNLKDINEKIGSLKGYAGKEISIPGAITPPKLEGYNCLIGDTNDTEYKEYSQDQVTFLADCGAFLDIKGCYISNETNQNCLKILPQPGQ